MPVVPGRHEIDARRESFRPVSVRVVVRDRDPAPLKMILPIAELREMAVASDQTGQVSTNPGENLDVVSIDRNTLNDLSMLDQDIVGSVSCFLDSSALGSGGATLVVNGLETSRIGVSPSGIQEVKINHNPHSAEFSRPGRGRIEIVTKANADAYHGTFNFLFRDYHLDARNAFAVERPPEQRRIFEGDFTGPLGRNGKTSFLITANHEDQELQAVVFASTPTGLYRANVATPEGQTEFSLGLNYQIGKKHTVSIRYEFGRDFKKNVGVGEFNLPEVGVNERGREDHLFFTQRTVFSAKLVNELSLHAAFEDNRSESVNPGVRKVIVQDAFTGGGAQVNLHSTRDHLQLNDAVTWLRGKHSIKTGVNVSDVGRRGAGDRTNFDGTYSFSTLENYTRTNPFLFQSNSGDPHIAFGQMVFGAFVQDDIRLRPNLSLGVGLRYDLQKHAPDGNNLSSRASFAFSPDRKRIIVIRGGARLFYDRAPDGAIGDSIRFDGVRLRQNLINNPAYPDPWQSQAIPQEIPPSVVRFAGDLRSPYSFQYGIGVERQLRKGTTITVNYVEIRGVKLFRSRDINAPLPACRATAYRDRVRQPSTCAGQGSSSLRRKRRTLRL